MKRVLVGVLSAGEPSLDRALEGIASQRGVSTELFHIAGWPKREAHRRLYATFTEHSDDFDFLVKVDADMELVHPRVLAAIGEVFDRFPGVDLVPVAVDDWLSGRQIWSLNAWRRGVRWTGEPPELFTDQAPNTIRGATGLLKAGLPLVVHAAQPSEIQSLRFGAHRALKAASESHAGRLRSVESIVEFCRENPTIERRLVLVAVESSLRDRRLGRQFVDSLPSTTTMRKAVLRASEVDVEILANQAIQRINEVRSTFGLGESSTPTLEKQPSARFVSRLNRSATFKTKRMLRPIVRLFRQHSLTPQEVLVRGLQ